MNFSPLSNQEEEAGRIIVDAAYKVHRQLGPGLVERVYEPCFCHELSKQGVSFQRQVVVPINYDRITFEEGLRLDVLVSNLVICELKSVAEMNPVWEAQLMTY